MAERFVNPYTFVPLRNGKKSTPKNDADDLLTGVIQCKLTTKTELVIPETGVPQKNDKQQQFDFFRIDGKLAIPGSSIRGPIRSAYETFTDSCMSLSDERLASKSGMKKPGILKKKDGRYILNQAIRCRVKNYSLIEGYESGDLIENMEIKETDVENSPVVQTIGRGSERGYLLRANKLGKSNPGIFMIDEIVNDDIPSKYIKAFKENVEMYVKNNDSAKHFVDYQKKLTVFIEDDNPSFMLPVWYNKETYKASDGGEVWTYQFALSQISRTVYSKTPIDFAKKRGLQPCADASNLCPACTLFGFVPKNGNGRGRASRVRFSDALCTDSSVETKKVYLPNLMEPRTSAFEMYLKNDNRSFTPDTPGTDLSGRKLYWHHKTGLKKESGWTDFNSYCEIAPKDVSFEFSVYFDGITSQQLNELVFTLTLGQYWTGGENLLHKIGRAKPVGGGSVLVEVMQVITRRADVVQYELNASDAWSEEKEIVEKRLPGFSSFKIAANFDAQANQRIDYPRKTDGGAIFEWFSNNRENFPKGHAQTYKQMLPLITDPEQRMSRGEERDRGKRGNATPRKNGNKTAYRNSRQRRDTSKTIMKGMIQDYDPNKTRGHIVSDGITYYFNKSHLAKSFPKREIKQGLEVKFTPCSNDYGPFASNIQQI